jgi:hypothetical protein
MRKFGLLAAAAGVMICGSVAQAGFIITSTRTQNSFTLNSQSFDTVTFTLTDNSTTPTNGSFNQIDLAMYDSTGGGNNGMLISALATGGPFGNNYPDLFQVFGEPSLPHTSWLNGQINTFLITRNFVGSAVATMNGSTFTFDQANSSSHFANAYTDQQLVAGLSADETWSSGNSATAGIVVAQATVLHGDSVTLVAPVVDGRTSPSTNWDTGGTAFGINGTPNIVAQSGPSLNTNPTGSGTGAYTDGNVAVPEPASIGFLGLLAGGLLARRRRQA